MIARRFVMVLVLAALAAVPAPVGADPKPGGFMSSNVTWLANIPLDSPGVGGRVVRVTDPILGPRTRFYVTGVRGLSIYDVTIPFAPLLLGHMPFPHWENEDVDVSADGKWVIVAFDIAGPSILVDASIPQAPHIAARIPGSEHTITCALADCSYAYGSTGRIYDLRDRSSPKLLATRWGGSGHDLSRDAAGYLHADTSPRMMLDPRANPASPTVVTRGTVPPSLRLAYQHNSIRPRADEWVPRAPGDVDPLLEPGELLLANGETNLTIRCNGVSNGPFATWSVVNFDRGAQMTPIDVFRPLENGDYTDGDPAVNALGCSGHWFTERDDVVAAGWYEHGTRFLHVDPRTGKISEVGFFQPVVGSASAAYWVDDSYVYTVDYIRGIDILRFDRAAPAPSRQEIAASWLAKLRAPERRITASERLRCLVGGARGVSFLQPGA